MHPPREGAIDGSRGMLTSLASRIKSRRERTIVPSSGSFISLVRLPLFPSPEGHWGGRKARFPTFQERLFSRIALAVNRIRVFRSRISRASPAGREIRDSRRLENAKCQNDF